MRDERGPVHRMQGREHLAHGVEAPTNRCLPTITSSCGRTPGPPIVAFPSITRVCMIAACTPASPTATHACVMACVMAWTIPTMTRACVMARVMTACTPASPTVWAPRPLRPDGMTRVELLRRLGRYFGETMTARQQRKGGAVRLRLRRIPSEKCRAAGSGYALATSSDAMP